MDMGIQRKFTALWNRHFPGAELPLAFYYTDAAGRAEAAPPDGPRCLICALARARQGTPLRFDVDNAAESFLITGSWDKVATRIAHSASQPDAERGEVHLLRSAR